MSTSFSFILTLNILWFSLSSCYDESVIHYASQRTEHVTFLTNISQGSVATRLRCGGIANDHCIVNFPEIVTVKGFLKSANIWWSSVYSIWGSLFWPTLYTPLTPTRLNCRVESCRVCTEFTTSWRRCRQVWTNLPTAKSSCDVSEVWTNRLAVVVSYLWIQYKPLTPTRLNTTVASRKRRQCVLGFIRIR